MGYPLIRKIFIWAIGISFSFSIVYVLFDQTLLALFTDIDQIKTAAQPYFIWVQIMPLLSFAAFIWDGIYIGAIAAKPMRNAMFFSSVLVFFPLFYGLQPYIYNHALWVAFIAFLFARGVFLHVFAKKYIYAAHHQ